MENKSKISQQRKQNDVDALMNSADLAFWGR